MKRKYIILSILTIVLFIVGCNATNEIQFRDIVSGNVTKIDMRDPSNGVLYSTTDKDLINDFISAMESSVYSESSPRGEVGHAVFRLYNENDEEIAYIAFEQENGININSKSYKLFCYLQ